MKTPTIKAKLKALTSSQIERLAELSDVSERTLWGIRSGNTKHASEVTIEKLAHGFRRMPRKPKTKGEKQ